MRRSLRMLLAAGVAQLPARPSSSRQPARMAHVGALSAAAEAALCSTSGRPEAAQAQTGRGWDWFRCRLVPS